MKAQQQNWVASVGNSFDRPQIGRVREVHFDGTLDIVLFSHRGEKIGRVSPALNGPKSYEPCCSPENWEVIAEPDFNFIADKGFWGRHLRRL